MNKNPFILIGCLAFALFTNVALALTGPTVLSLLPVDNATNITPGMHIYITFDRPVSKGTTAGNIYLKRVSDNTIAYTTPMSSLVDIKFLSGNKVEIMVEYGGNEAYYVEIPNNAFKDANGEFFSGFSLPTDWNFTTFGDVTPPSVTTLIPANSATGVAANTLLNIVFDETIQTVSGSIMVKQTSDNATVVSVDVSNPNGHLQKTSTSLSISAPLKPNTSYYVILPESAVRDIYGNYFAGYTTNTSWTFTTSSTQNTNPSVTSLTPNDNAIDLPPADHIYITFDKNVFKGSGNILLKRISDNSVVYTTSLTSMVDIKVNGAVVEILLPYGGNDSYYVEIPNTAFRDANNNYFPGFSTNSDWNFTTLSDLIAPVIAQQDPLHQATGVINNSLITMTFNENIEMASGVIEVKQVTTNESVVSVNVSNANPHLQKTSTTVTLSAPLKPSTSYYVIVPATAIRDLYGNYFAGFTSATAWTFTTSSVQNTLPAIISLAPSDNATDVTPASHVLISFDKNISKGTGDILLRRASDNAIVYTTPLWSLVDVKILNGSTAEILLPFEKNNSYYIEIPGTAFRDNNNNYFNGFAGNSAWNFQALYDAPTITAIAPASVGQGGSITITGTNFFDVSSVTFGGVAASAFAINSSTSITATVGQGATGNVSVTTPGGTVSKSGFTFIPEPAVTAFNPASASKGTSVTISGTDFTGTTNVKFGDLNAQSFVVNSSGSITAIVGEGATGSISVTTPGGIGSKAGFTFIPPPFISAFTPLAAGAEKTVSITGHNFDNASSVTFGGIPASSFVVTSPGSISAKVGAGASGNVTVTTPGGTASKSGFVFIEKPSISEFSPAAAGAGDVVIISGLNFDGASTVKFGGVAASSFMLISGSSVRAILAEGASGAVTIETPEGIASKDGFTFLDPVMSLEVQSSNSFLVYPNPCKDDHLFIQLAESLSDGRKIHISLTDITGKTHVSVWTEYNSTIRLDVPSRSVPKGLYVVTISTSRGTAVRKVSII
jgi:hypothetical protein